MKFMPSRERKAILSFNHLESMFQLLAFTVAQVQSLGFKFTDVILGSILCLVADITTVYRQICTDQRRFVHR